MDIIVGTYEELVIGFSLLQHEETWTFKTVFTDHSHTGSVRCVAISQNGIIASGSSDETIHVMDLKQQKDLGVLNLQEGSITSMSFYKDSHLFSASEDCTFCIWNCSSWECLRRFRGHMGAITSAAVHPSAKLALTVSRDKTMKTWNLVNGRRAFTKNLHQEVDRVVWNGTGSLYATTINKTINVYAVKDAAVFLSIDEQFRINCMEFLNEDEIIYGTDNGIIKIHDLRSNEIIYEHSTHTNRIRGLCFIKLDGTADHLLVTASSDGCIIAWRLLRPKEKYVLKKCAATRCSFRPTCIAGSASVARSPKVAEPEKQAAAANVSKRARVVVEYDEAVPGETEGGEPSSGKKELNEAANVKKLKKKKRKKVAM